MAKSYQKLDRPQVPEEAHLRAAIEAALKTDKFYGHRTMGRARNIYIEMLLDQHYLDYMADKMVPLDGYDPSLPA